jgi:hypothetical protein
MSATKKEVTHLEHFTLEPRDWKRTHKNGHASFVTRSTALHRLYMAHPKLAPLNAHEIMEGGRFVTDFATYERGA